MLQAGPLPGAPSSFGSRESSLPPGEGSDPASPSYIEAVRMRRNTVSPDRLAVQR